MFLYSVTQGEYDFVGAFDRAYIVILAAFLLMALDVTISTLYNVFNQTDEVLKLKDKNRLKKQNVDLNKTEKERKSRLSLSEVYAFIYGKNEPIWRAILASFF